MSTVSLPIAETVKANNGYYPGDEHLPPIVKIVEYTSMWGTLGYGLIYRGQNPESYAASEHVINPKTWWERT